jgi:hypothetical protein
MRCSSESGWFSKRKFPRTEAKRLYVFEGWSTPQIAKKFNVAPNAIRQALIKMDVVLRTHTSTRICRVEGCSEPTYKCLNRNAVGVSLSGTMCLKHTKELQKRKNDAASKRRKLRKQNATDGIDARRMDGHTQSERSTHSEAC